MSPNSRRRSIEWRPIRTGWLLPFLALWACNAHDLQVPKPNPQQQSDFTIIVSPNRAVDILFMIDNSPSMDPKQAALAENFPKMIEALTQLEGGLPDVRIGVISSDMGAGWGEAKYNCALPLGNRGILWGNDPTVDSAVKVDEYTSVNQFATVKDIKNGAGFDGCGMNPGARWIQDVRDTDGATRSRNYQGNLADVFSCLAKAVGVGGCGYEHPLQAVRLALNPMPEVNQAQNAGFLRPEAFLAVVLIDDEDDCSADPDSRTNDGMFYPPLLRETASLRCAARGHVCNGKDIPNYDPSLGYTASGPFEANLLDCDAKDVERQPPKDPNETDPTYQKLPLIRIRDMIDGVNQVKQRPLDQILVSGIIGWPQDGEQANAKYRIDKDSTSLGAQKDLWDYMPICSVPDQKSADGNIYKAYGGFRLKKFIDAFKKQDEKSVFSICSTSNFHDAMGKIGDAIVTRLTPGCVTYPLIDIEPNLEEVQPQCQVVDKIVCDPPGKGTCLSSGYHEERLPECKNPETGDSLNPQNPEKSKVPNEARPCWYLVYDDNPKTGCPKAFKHQRISALRKNDGLAPPGTLLGMQCLTCALPSHGDESSCPALGTM